MHRLLLTAVATAIVATTALIPSRAGAIPLSGLADIPMALEGINPIEKVAVCFYFDGWHGPGLYQCGYRLRVNEGWVGERHERDERRERFEDRGDRREGREGREGRGDRREGREGREGRGEREGRQGLIQTGVCHLSTPPMAARAHDLAS